MCVRACAARRVRTADSARGWHPVTAMNRLTSVRRLLGAGLAAAAVIVACRTSEAPPVAPRPEPIQPVPGAPRPIRPTLPTPDAGVVPSPTPGPGTPSFGPAVLRSYVGGSAFGAQGGTDDAGPPTVPVADASASDVMDLPPVPDGAFPADAATISTP